jgi:hypothetical protein
MEHLQNFLPFAKSIEIGARDSRDERETETERCVKCWARMLPRRKPANSPSLNPEPNTSCIPLIHPIRSGTTQSMSQEEEVPSTFCPLGFLCF